MADEPALTGYRITDKTRELDGMMLTLRQWGMRHCGFDPQAECAVTMIHRRTGAAIDADWQPSEADLPFSFSQVESHIYSGRAGERAARAQAFALEKRSRVAGRTSKKSAAKSRGKVKRKTARTVASGR
jgi:hypothetical protein